ncbi:hypothetical protein RI367_007148 [Sorochytrium milnesiophthora]
MTSEKEKDRRNFASVSTSSSSSFHGAGGGSSSTWHQPPAYESTGYQDHGSSSSVAAPSLPPRPPSQQQLQQLAQKEQQLAQTASLLASLAKTYGTKIRPVEQMYLFEGFHSPPLADADISTKPMVTLLGQYSVGKTSLIEYLLGEPYHGAHIGPEPTTDGFVAVTAPKSSHAYPHSVPGNAACADKSLPFTGLGHFGSSFMSKFSVAYSTAPILEGITLIDTPGVLSGEKQRIQRQYDFIEAHISDEFRDTIHALKGNEDKIRILLNKADMVNPQERLRVYGALLWSLGKVMHTPEVPRVHIGSFSKNRVPRSYSAGSTNQEQDLVEMESQALVDDVRLLPQQSLVRRINEVIKRARQLRAHSYIVSHLRSELPMFNKGAKQEAILQNLEQEFSRIQHLYRLPPGDFPDPDKYRLPLQTVKIKNFPKLDKRALAGLDEAISDDIPRLLRFVG